MNLSGHGKSERESSATWYRYGVPLTDVYDVVDVLGQGHMGEVFTVRRKTTGHHSDQTREKLKENDLEKILDNETKKAKKYIVSLSPPRKGMKSVANNAKNVAKKMVGKKDPKLTEESDSNLAQFIQSVTPKKFHEPSPRESLSSPVKGIIKRNVDVSAHNSLEVSVSALSLSSLDSTGKQERPSLAKKKSVHFQRTFAVKTILTSRIQKEQMNELVNEIMVLRKLDHPYVLKLYEVYHVKRKLWLVTELLTGGDLASRKHSEHATKNAIDQVLRALVYLHRMGVVHRDIKLENVLYENNSKNATVRLIDFGLSKAFDRTSVTGDYARTPYTLTPEAASHGHRFASDKSDVWAVGVMTFIMLSGEFPFVKSHEDLKNDDIMDRLKRVSVAILLYFRV